MDLPRLSSRCVTRCFWLLAGVLNGTKKNKRNELSFSRERHRRILRTHAALRAFLRSQKRLPGEVPYITFLPSTLPAYLTEEKRKIN